ncbi:unnamed protein product [Rotaria sp. Silwood2]|nr:unnamed protein product [Rotaria sp. Silwood2]CAF2511714.1 unnamed protein product [Rotaria sp. Silwood2]CAF2744863.1 unnamed protein product [Rotaria sp. Silwood2]CAF3271442.1 unnamed protein product [Rotaria sp. Silwood2]CAF3886894.1 unnamed protein product [Rotaria sp. Silwood2]
MDMLRLQPSTDSSSNDMMDKAKRVWNMLDELQSSDPTAYKQFIEKTLNEGKEWMAPPTPCLAVQSTLHSNPNIKVFYLNIFTWLRLPSPTKNDELTKMYSLTPTEITHNNESCILVNIAVHPNVMKIIGRTQLIRSTFDLVVSQYNLLVDYNHYKFLDEKAIGNIEEIQQNFLQPILKNKNNDENLEDLINNDFSPSLINQLSSMTMTEQSSSSNKQQQQKKKNIKAPVLIEELWTIPTYTEEISNNNNFLIIRVSLPECESVADCDVTVLPWEDTVQVECSKIHMRLKLDMKKRKKPNIPHCNSVFDIQRLTAKFVRKTQQLILTIPIIVEPNTNE